jgi:Fe-S cluster assembly iron-binding protein IscA
MRDIACTHREGARMLTVTEDARVHLAKVLDNANASADAAVRFVAEGGAIKPKLDRIRSGDVMFEFAGKTVLALDEQMSLTLDNHVLDVDDDSNGARLILLQC